MAQTDFEIRLAMHPCEERGVIVWLRGIKDLSGHIEYKWQISDGPWLDTRQDCITDEDEAQMRRNLK